MPMTAFDTLAQAPQGVARLRELILTLAVQGKLLPQDPSDEPASELLKKIRAEKDRLIAEGKIKKDKPLAPISEEEKPFELPSGWEWVRIPEVTHGLGQGEPMVDFSYVDVASVDNDKGVIRNDVKIISAKDAPSRARKFVRLGTVIYSTVRPYLKNIAVVDKVYSPPAIASTAFAVMHPHGGVSSKYVLHYMRSQIFTEYVNSKAIGVAYPAINDANFFQGVIPLPPEKEQTRIVARVEELMRLCDALEEKGRLEHTQHQQLLQAMLDSLTQTTDAQELARHWQRLAQHFDLLIDRPEAVDALEQTILQLAVRGLLVPRAAGDQPASDVLLGDIAELINGDRGSNYPNKEEYVEEGIPFINTGHIDPDGKLSDARMNKITRAKFNSLRSGKVRKNDLVYCLRGATLGKTAIVEYEEGAIASSLVIIRPSEKINKDFLYLFLVSPEGRKNIYLYDNGSAQPNLAANSVRKYKIKLPSLVEQSRIVARVTELRALCQQLRDTLTQSQRTQADWAQAWVTRAAA